MSIILKRAAVFGAIAGLSACSQGQENIFRPNPGSKHFSISGNWTTLGGVNTYQIILGGGWYLTDRLSAVAKFGLAKHSPEEREYFIGARYDLKRNGSSMPYLLAGIEFHDGARPQTVLILDPNAGPKATFFEGGIGLDFFLGPNSSFFGEFVGFKTSSEQSIGVDFTVGVRFFFK